MRRCEVYVHNIKAGILTEAPDGYVFEYDADYLQNNGNPPVCLAMPLRNEPYRSPHLFPFFWISGFSRLVEQGFQEYGLTLYHGTY